MAKLDARVEKTLTHDSMPPGYEISRGLRQSVSADASVLASYVYASGYEWSGTNHFTSRSGGR